MIDIFDTLRMRDTLFGGPERRPDNTPKVFAPFSVWSKVRASSVLGLVLWPLGVGMTLALDSAGPLFLLIVALPITPILITRGLFDFKSRFMAPITEVAGFFLASRYCPCCGQSIFDNAPASGYMADSERGTWWPHRHCASCGHDLKVRTCD